MPSAALIGIGLFLVVFFGWALLNPQRMYEIRQSGQTNDSPQLSASGKLKWQLIDAVVVLLGVGTVLLGVTE
jgi:TRAP-type mannitol/chloroaromatic compound transport system permease large subunit